MLVPYWSSLGLTLSEILLIQSAFGISVAFFEIPTGYIADLWSRKISISAGAFLFGVSFSCMPFATSFNELLILEVVLGLASALSSGADTALVYDSLPTDVPRLKLLGNIHLFALLGEALASITAAILVLWSFSAVTYAQAIVGWLPFLLSLFFIEPSFERMSKSGHLNNCREVFRFLFFDDSLVRLVFINGVIWGLSSFCIVWLQQAYWSQSGVPLSHFGYLWAVLMLIAAVCSRLTHSFERLVGAPSLLLLLATAPCLGYFFMGVGPTALGVFAGVLFYFNRGVASVILTDAFNWKIPARFRSTANSIRSLFFRLISSVMVPVIGLIVDNWGINVGLLSLGGFFTLLFFFALLPLRTRINELRVDYIPVGSANTAQSDE